MVCGTASGGEARVPFGATQAGRVASRILGARMPGLSPKDKGVYAAGGKWRSI